MDIERGRRTHYEVLGVSPEASRATIRSAYRRLARSTHPDMGGTADEFAAVSLAWDVLSTAQRRAEYDASLLDAGDDWGADVGFDVPFSAPGPASATPEPPPPPTPAGSSVVPVGVPAPPASVDPCTSDPLVLPRQIVNPWARWSPEVDAVHRAIGPFALLWFVTGLVLVLLRDGRPLPIGPTAIAGIVTFAFCCAGGAALVVLSADGRGAARAAARALLWGSILFYSVMAIEFVADGTHGTELSRAVVALVVLGGSVALGIWSERAAARSRAALRARRDDIWDLADEWNRLLRTRRAFLADGRACRLEPTSAGDWVLVADGEIIATAPGRALAAWVRHARRTGLAVERPASGAGQRTTEAALD